MIENIILRRLSGKLLLMTITFVMLAEMVIFIPSAALYRQTWLEDRAERAGHITLAQTGVPDYEGSEFLSKQFMEDTDIVMLSTKRDGMTELVLGFPPESDQFELVDLRENGRLPKFRDMFRSFFGPETGYLRVQADPVVAGQEVMEYIVPRASLKQALRDYARRIFWLSAAIALMTGLGLYLALSAMIVRPIKKLAKGLADFRENPELRRANLKPGRRQDEIGQLQREFYDMKQSVRASFKQRERLATLGTAVAKINHDLRNVLTSAQLISDRLAMDKEERVAHMGQRLVRAVDRGIKLCADVLNFSQSREDPPDFETLRVSLLLGEVAADVLGSFGSGARSIHFRNKVPTESVIWADADHTYRVFHNIFRNAAQAMASLPDDNAPRVLTVSNEVDGNRFMIDIADTGPGLPAKVQENLFKAFVSASGHGSTGLGLTISRELAVAQGGDLSLKETGETGTIFTVSFLADKPAA